MQGFTLTELMMTISIIIILVSALSLALNSARTSAMAADTTSRLTTLKMATIRFRDDIGYLPAVLDMNRNLAPLPEFPDFSTGGSLTGYRYVNQSWHSITSPAEFFLGYGEFRSGHASAKRTRYSLLERFRRKGGGLIL